MQTIPNEVLDKIVEHRPHLAALVANLRTHPKQAAQIERAIATAYLLGEVRLDGPEAAWLAQVERGGPWGGAWVTTSHAAALTGYDESHLRRMAGAGTLPAIKRGKTWYVARANLPARDEPADLPVKDKPAE